MWQRFTEKARKTVFYAQEEAGLLGENFVSTEHLLLGILRERDCVGVRLIMQTGVSVDRVEAEIRRVLSRGDGRLGHDMQLTPSGKRVIDLAYDEARKLSDSYIGTEHLVLGMIREREGLAGRVLISMGVDLEKARQATLLIRQSGVTEKSAPKARSRRRAATPFNPKSFWDMVTIQARRAVHRAAGEAIRQGTQTVTVEMLYLGLVSQPTAATTVLTSLGVDVDRVVNKIRSAQPNPPPSEVADRTRIVLSEPARACLLRAREVAKSSRYSFIGPDHLLIAIVQESGATAIAPDVNFPPGSVASFLYEEGVSPDTVTTRVIALQATPPTDDHGSVWPPPITTRTTVVPSALPISQEATIRTILSGVRLSLGIAIGYVAVGAGFTVYENILSHAPLALGWLSILSPASLWPATVLAPYALLQARRANQMDPGRHAGRSEMIVAAILCSAAITALIYFWTV